MNFSRLKIKQYLELKPKVAIGFTIFLLLIIFGLSFSFAYLTTNRELVKSSLISPAPATTLNLTKSPVTLSSPSPKSTNFSALIPTQQPIPILMYHYIRDYHRDNDKVGNNLSVSPAIFAQQLQTLKTAGYQTINFNQLASGENLPAKPIILTFDDGYADAFTSALPALKKEGMTGVFYVVSQFLDKPNYLTSQQVKELAQAGMQIGSHTVSHGNLASMTLARQRQQLTESQAVLEQLIGQSVLDFCYPSGQYNQQTIQLLTEIGYRSATTVKEGIANGENLLRRPYELPRIRVTAGTDLLSKLGGSNE